MPIPTRDERRILFIDNKRSLHLFVTWAAEDRAEEREGSCLVCSKLSCLFLTWSCLNVEAEFLDCKAVRDVISCQDNAHSVALVDCDGVWCEDKLLRDHMEFLNITRWLRLCGGLT